MDSKLLNVRCDNCGAEYRINSRGEMVCRFCGSVIYLSDKDFEKYKRTRDEMLMNDRFMNDEIQEDGDVLGLWRCGSTVNFTAKTGTVISFESFYSVILPGKEIYIGSEKVAVIFDDKEDITRTSDNVAKMLYPSADIKGLNKYLPNIKYRAELEDGKGLMILSKAENVYPIFLFENLKATTVAWMISRFENLGCLLEFNDKDFPALRAEDVFINPKTHELFLLGGWETVRSTPRRNYLADFRTIAKSIMDESTAPEQCIAFLNREPESTAYDDFKLWDFVIMNGFNGHNFRKFNE